MKADTRQRLITISFEDAIMPAVSSRLDSGPSSQPSELRERAGEIMVFSGEANPVKVVHSCEGCDEPLAVHEHANHPQVKDCRVTMRPLCDECGRWGSSSIHR